MIHPKKKRSNVHFLGHAFRDDTSIAGGARHIAPRVAAVAKAMECHERSNVHFSEQAFRDDASIAGGARYIAPRAAAAVAKAMEWFYVARGGLLPGYYMICRNGLDNMTAWHRCSTYVGRLALYALLVVSSQFRSP